jgi:hypothetical protein
MKAMIAGRLGKTLFVYTLLLVAGCSHHSDIGLDRNHAMVLRPKALKLTSPA